MPPLPAHSVGSDGPAAAVDYANMKDTTGKNQRNRRRKPGSDAFEIGEIRVSSRPGPDARDRLRRIITMMIKHASRDRQAARGENASPGDPQAEDHAEGGD